MVTTISNTIVQGSDNASAVTLASGDIFNLLPTGFLLAYGLTNSNGVTALAGFDVFNITGTIISTNGDGIIARSGGHSFAIASTATVFGLFDGINVSDNFNTFVNAGDIGARENGVLFSGGGTTFTNSGNIIATNFNAVDFLGGSNSFSNSGYMSGGLNGLGVGGVNNSIVNSGTISGGTGITTLGASGVDAVFNTGSIIGTSAAAYTGSNAQNNILNNGLMQGSGSTAIDLGGGNDVYDGRGGTLIGAVLGGDGDDVIYGGLGNETLQGGNNNDQIYGGGGADTINGDAGNDLIVGGPGGDVLRGGLGGDLFVFNVGDNGDLIRSFNEGGVRDGFDLRGYFDATGFTGADPRAAGIMQVLQNGANTDVYLHGAFAFRIEGVVAAAIDNSYFLIQ